MLTNRWSGGVCRSVSVCEYRLFKQQNWRIRESRGRIMLWSHNSTSLLTSRSLLDEKTKLTGAVKGWAINTAATGKCKESEVMYSDTAVLTEVHLITTRGHCDPNTCSHSGPSNLNRLRCKFNSKTILIKCYDEAAASIEEINHKRFANTHRPTVISPGFQNSIRVCFCLKA